MAIFTLYFGFYIQQTEMNIIKNFTKQSIHRIFSIKYKLQSKKKTSSFLLVQTYCLEILCYEMERNGKDNNENYY